MPVKAKLNSIYSTLPPAERRIATYILENEKFATKMTINELAQAAEVSLPSVTRLVKRLGYERFSRFKVALASGSASLVKGAVDSINDTDGDEVLIEKLMNGQLRAMESTMLSLDKSEIISFCRKIVLSDRIIFFAKEDDANICSDLCRELAVMGYDSLIVNDVKLMKTYASKLGSSDVFFGISKSALTNELCESIQIASNNGAVTALISNLFDVGVSKQIDYIFSVSRLEEIYRLNGFESDSAQRAVIELILILVKRQFSRRTENTDENTL